MPQITDVSPQKRNKDKLNIFLDGKFAFSVSLENLVKKNLKVGKILTLDEISKILQIEKGQSLLDKTINFLSFRPRSEKETRDYLAKKIAHDNGVSFFQAKNSKQIEKTIAKLKKYNYLNDLEFAKWWLLSRSSSNPKGINVIKMELRQKGISQELIEKVLINTPNQLSLAKKIITKKQKYWQKLTPFEQKRKIYTYLAARGFDRDTIEDIIAIIGKKI